MMTRGGEDMGEEKMIGGNEMSTFGNHILYAAVDMYTFHPRLSMHENFLFDMKDGY